jgi:hypothetical protein
MFTRRAGTGTVLVTVLAGVVLCGLLVRLGTSLGTSAPTAGADPAGGRIWRAGSSDRGGQGRGKIPALRRLPPEDQRPGRAPPGGAEPVPASLEPEPTPAEIVARIDARFYSEPAETEWGRRAARRTTAVFRRLATPSTRLGRIECRATLCRVEATHRDVDDFQAYVTSVAADPIDERDEGRLWNAGFTAQVISTSPAGVGAITYVSREDAPVPGAEDPPAAASTAAN